MSQGWITQDREFIEYINKNLKTALEFKLLNACILLASWNPPFDFIYSQAMLSKVAGKKIYKYYDKWNKKDVVRSDTKNFNKVFRRLYQLRLVHRKKININGGNQLGSKFEFDYHYTVLCLKKPKGGGLRCTKPKFDGRD